LRHVTLCTRGVPGNQELRLNSAASGTRSLRSSSESVMASIGSSASPSYKVAPDFLAHLLYLSLLGYAIRILFLFSPAFIALSVATHLAVLHLVKCHIQLLIFFYLVAFSTGAEDTIISFPPSHLLTFGKA
jgi:hypothetical protein